MGRAVGRFRRALLPPGRVDRGGHPGPGAAADPAHVDLFADANVRMWEEIAEAGHSDWTAKMAQAARDWHAYRLAVLRPILPRGAGYPAVRSPNDESD